MKKVKLTLPGSSMGLASSRISLEKNSLKFLYLLGFGSFISDMLSCKLKLSIKGTI
jgi:hypothetical protein